MTDDKPVTHWLARDLIEHGLCTPQCLLAAEGDAEASAECGCRCLGVLHGALALGVIVHRDLPGHFAVAAAAEGRPDLMASLLGKGGAIGMTDDEFVYLAAERLLTEVRRGVAAGTIDASEIGQAEAFVEATQERAFR